MRRRALQPIPVPAPEYDSTLVGSWCQYNARSALVDASSSGNDLSINGTVRLGQNNSFIGDGATGYLRKAVANFRSSDSAGTIECWFKLAAVGAYQVILGTSDEAGTANYFAFGVKNTNVPVLVIARTGETSIILDGATTLVVGRWYHLVLASSGTAYTMFLDGASEAVSPSSGANDGTWFGDISGRDNLTIGAGVHTSAFWYANAEIRGVNVFSEAKNLAWANTQFQRGVPSNSLVLSVNSDGRDFSRYRSDLTPVGGPIIGARQMTFNGTSQYLRRAEANWRSADTAGTIRAWINRAAVGADHAVFATCDEAGSLNYFVVMVDQTTNTVNIQTANGAATAAAVRGSTSLAASRWYRVAAVSSGSAWSIYVNGVAETLTVTAGTNNGRWFNGVTARDNVVVGCLVRNTNAWYFNGSINDVLVDNRALSADEVMLDYLATRGAY